MYVFENIFFRVYVYMRVCVWKKPCYANNIFDIHMPILSFSLSLFLPLRYITTPNGTRNSIIFSYFATVAVLNLS